jgi:N-methylhydantoinase B
VTNRAAWIRDTEVEEDFAAGRLPHTMEEIGGRPEGLAPISEGRPWQAGTGTVVHYRVSGSAGYGDPLEREVGLLDEDIELGYVSREAATDIYGVVFAGEEIDAGATNSNRGEIRERRLSEFRAPERRLKEEPTLSTPQGDGIQLAETVEARATADGEHYCCCTECGTTLSPLRAAIKEWLPMQALPAQEISPAQHDPAELVDGDFEFRRWCCPGCGRLVDTEIGRGDDPPLDAARIEAFAAEEAR